MPLEPHEEPVLVKIIDDYGLPDYDTKDGQVRLNAEAKITGCLLVLAVGGMIGLY